ASTVRRLPADLLGSGRSSSLATSSPDVSIAARPAWCSNWRSPVRSSAIRDCCCSTSRRGRSTPRPSDDSGERSTLAPISGCSSRRTGKTTSLAVTAASTSHRHERYGDSSTGPPGPFDRDLLSAFVPPRALLRARQPHALLLHLQDVRRLRPERSRE